MKTIVTFIVLISTVGNLLAQSDQENLEKYWLYRDRLKKEFLVVGPGPGESIPAEEIDPRRSIFGVIDTTIVQSDGTIHLGYYIAVLATEYKLLRNHNYSVNDLIKELYFALNAVWRMDAQSDFYGYDNNDYHSGGCYTLSAGAPLGPMDSMNYNDDNILDGFIIRSDAPFGFEVNFPGVHQVTSDLLSPSENCRNKEMSQDQAIFMLMGLYAVRELVDPWVSFNGVPLREFAINEGLRIVEKLKNTGNWKLTNPANNDLEVQRGSSGFGWGYPKAKLGYAMNGGSGGFQNALSISQRALWNFQQYPGIAGQEVNLGMAAAMAGIGRSWTFCAINTYPPLAYLLCALPTPNSTLAGLNRFANPNRAREIYYLYHKVMYNTSGTHSNTGSQAYRSMLNLAPCEGPYSTYPNTASHFGWTIHNRFVGTRYNRMDIDNDGTNDELDKFISGNYFTQGVKYNGLDYMLLHNLFHLAFQGSGSDPNVQWENLVNARVDNDWPYFHQPSAGSFNQNYLNAFLGSDFVPRTIRAIKTLQSDSEIGSSTAPYRNGNVSYRAGEEVWLTDGFEVKPGATFEAYIQPLECINGELQRSEDPSQNPDRLYLDSLAMVADSVERNETDSILAALGMSVEELEVQQRDFEWKWATIYEPQLEAEGSAGSPLVKIRLDKESGKYLIEMNIQNTQIAQVSIESLKDDINFFLEKGDTVEAGLNEWSFEVKNCEPGEYLFLFLGEKSIISKPFKVE